MLLFHSTTCGEIKIVNSQCSRLHFIIVVITPQSPAGCGTQVPAWEHHEHAMVRTIDLRIIKLMSHNYTA